MRRALLATFLLTGACFVASCRDNPPPANNERRGEILDELIANMGSQAKCAGTRSIAQIRSVDGDVKAAQALRAEGWWK